MFTIHIPSSFISFFQISSKMATFCSFPGIEGERSPSRATLLNNSSDQLFEESSSFIPYIQVRSTGSLDKYCTYLDFEHITQKRKKSLCLLGGTVGMGIFLILLKILSGALVRNHLNCYLKLASLDQN